MVGGRGQLNVLSGVVERVVNALPPAPLQVSESPWFHAPSLKSSCEYVSVYHQPAAKMEDSNSDDYINVPA